MARYKLVLEIEDVDGFSEERIDEAIREGLENIGVAVVDSKPFERVKEKEEELLKELQAYVENIESDNVEVTFDKGTYYLLHICENNMPVPLYQTTNINEIKEYIHSNY